MSSNRKRLNRQRQVQYYHSRRRQQFKPDSRRVTNTERDSVCSEGEGLCSEVSESGTRRQQSEYENRPN